MGSTCEEERQRVRDMLTGAITLLCKEQLPYKQNLTIQGLIGITLDSNVFLIQLNENIHNDKLDATHQKKLCGYSASTSSASELSQKKRKRCHSNGEGVSPDRSNNKGQKMAEPALKMTFSPIDFTKCKIEESHSNESSNHGNPPTGTDVMSPGTSVSPRNDRDETQSSAAFNASPESLNPDIDSRSSIQSENEAVKFELPQSSVDSEAEPYIKHMVHLHQQRVMMYPSGDHTESSDSLTSTTTPWMGSQIDRIQSQAALSCWPGLQEQESATPRKNEPLSQNQRKLGYLPVPQMALLGGEPAHTMKGRCHLCPRLVDRKTRRMCTACNQRVCSGHSTYSLICDHCLPT